MNQRPAPKPALYLLLVYVLVMAGVAIYYGVQAYQAYQEDDPAKRTWPLLVFIWSAANAVIGGTVVGKALTYRPQAPEQPREAPMKIVWLTVGGVLGFTTFAVFGFLFMLLDIFGAQEWWKAASGGRQAWLKWAPWAPIVWTLVGLAIMFVSLLVARSEERTNPTLRRLLYGYNAFLTGLLVFAILGVGNVFAFFYGSHAFDWTATNLYSITPKTRQILERLDVPVKIYVLLSPRDPLYTDVETLINTCQSYSSKLTVDYVASRRTLAELIEKYELADNTAILVVTEYEGKSVHQGITPEDLEDFRSRFSSEGQQRSFKGEQAIMSAIANLRGGKATLTVYFTQDSGEMKLSEFGGGRGRPAAALDRGLGALKSKLEKLNYVVKEWKLGELDEQTKSPAPIPDDAAAVIMAGPTDLGEPALAAAKIKVLQNYMMKPKARMLLLLEPRRNRDGEVQPTGLETFLASFGVKVGRDIIIHPPFGPFTEPTDAQVYMPSQADRTFREAFTADNLIIPFSDTRSIQPDLQAANVTAATLYETAPILRGNTAQWAVATLPRDLERYFEQMGEKNPEELTKLLRSPPISVAVTVRDKSSAADPNDPHAFMRQGAEGAPRMIVFGSASIAANARIDGRSDVYFNLISSSLGWLRDRPDVMSDIQPRERKAYRLNVKAGETTSILLTPGLLLLVAIIGCGVGVWFVRRR